MEGGVLIWDVGRSAFFRPPGKLVEYLGPLEEIQESLSDGRRDTVELATSGSNTPIFLGEDFRLVHDHSHQFRTSFLRQ